MACLINTSGYDLAHCGVFATEQLYEADSDHCLVRALKLYQLNTSSVEKYINGRDFTNRCHVFPKKKLRIVADKLQVNIALCYLNVHEELGWTSYPVKKPYPSTITLGLYRDMYLANRRVTYRIPDVIGTEHSTMRVLHYFAEINAIHIIQLKPETVPRRIVVPLDVVMNEQEPFKHKPPKRILNHNDSSKVTISYADIESIIRPKHIPLMYARYSTTPSTQENCKVMSHFYLVSEGADVKWLALRKFLEQFPNGYNIVYFHNLKYDWTVIKNNPHINIRSVVKKEGMYYSVTFIYFKKIFELRDTYKFVPKKLSEFSSMFGLDVTKKNEYILYELYTVTNTTTVDYVTYRDLLLNDAAEYTYDLTPASVTKRMTPITNHSQYLLLDERIAVDRIITTLMPRYFRNGRYYHIAHCEYYLHSDCELLYKGMEVYRQRMLDLLHVDCHTKITLPSLVHERMSVTGCYDGVYALKDNLRKFVAESIHGGRVATKDNKKWDVSGNLQILDGRSLYPSAISRLCRPTTQDQSNIKGLPIGKALAIRDWSSRDLFSYYIVRINITAINRAQQIPFVSYYEHDARHYTNRACAQLRNIVVDKITLEDWISFQQIEYEFIEGICWVEGGNDTIGCFVEGLYDSRRKYVEAGNISMSEVCKLALNSLYGKTIVKPALKFVVKDNTKVADYLADNFESLIDMEECCNQSIITVQGDDTNHTNMAHVGGMVLSMARRIMNEVLDLGNTLGINMYYTDTDSIHIDDSNDNIERLAKAYHERYGRELIGTQLGQFSYELKYPDHAGIYSQRAIILGKKAYLHQVCGLNKDGVMESYSYCRMKGVNHFAMSEYPDKLELYTRLLKGEVVPFDLTYGDAVMFKYRGCVETKESYIRKVSFDGELGTI